MVRVGAPAARAAVLRVGTPPANAPVPIEAPASLKITVPVGVPPALATVAVKVTGCPGTLGFTDDVTATVVAAWPTVWVNTDEVLDALLGSPPKAAVTACDPDVSAAVVNVATPEPLSVPVPSAVAPS